MIQRCDCRPTVRRLEKTCSGRWRGGYYVQTTAVDLDSLLM